MSPSKREEQPIQDATFTIRHETALNGDEHEGTANGDGTPNGDRPVNAPASEESGRVGVLEAMRWHWWLVAIPVAILVTLSAAFAIVRSPTYTASAHLSVGFGADSPSSLPGSVTAAQALADSYSRSIAATSVVDETARRAHTSPQTVSADVLATPIPNSTVITLNATGASPKAAITLANAAADSLTAYTGKLGGPDSGSTAVLNRYRQSQVVYQSLLDAQKSAENAAAKDPGPRSDLALRQARVRTQVALLQSESLGATYQTSQQSYVAPLTVLNRATSAFSDRSSKLQLLLFVSLIAGLAIGATLATVRANRI